MQAITLSILQRGNQALAPASGTDLVRLVDLQAAVAGCVPVGQTYTASQITDFNAAVLAQLVANGVSLSGTGTVMLLVNGGLKYTGGLLGIDSGVVSLVGHTHTAAQISNFNAAVLGVLAANGVVLSGTGSVPLLANGGLKYTGTALGVDSGTVSLVGHTHTSAAITDWNAALASWALANGVAVGGSGIVSLLPGGGLMYGNNGNNGLMVNSGIVSFIGHQHRAVDVVDLPSAVTGLMLSNLQASTTVAPSGTGPFSFRVITAPGGGLLVTAAGLGVDSGVVSLVGHTHAQLHNPLTLGSMNTIAATLANQQLQMEVRVVPGGGVLATPSGVQVDWSVVGRNGNYGNNGNYALGTANTATVQLSLNSGTLTATVPLDPNPPGGTGGLIVAGVNGLRVALGTASNVAAAGNHTHAAASETTDGFLSASDKTRLDTLWASPPPSGIQTVNTATLVLGLNGSGQLSGTVQYQTNPIFGRGAINADANGLYVVLGTANNVSAAGNHLHDGRYLQLTGGVMTGPLTLASDPTVALMAATKQYVDNAVAGGAGGSLSGTLSVHSGIPNAATTGNNPPSQADFNALVGTVNSILSLLRALGLPS